MASDGFMEYPFTVPILLAILSIWSFFIAKRFNELNNGLLTAEMLFIAISAGCGAITVWTGSSITEFVWNYLDIFSRIAGVTVIMALGVLYVTSGLSFTTKQELIIIAAGLIAALLFMFVPALFAIREWVFLLMGVFFLVVLWYMAYVCFRRGMWIYGLHILIVSFGFLIIAFIESLIQLPSPQDSPLFNKKVIGQVLQIWGYWAIYITYVALLNSKKERAE